jgi:branched-chain amino acid transport system permease protein
MTPPDRQRAEPAKQASTGSVNRPASRLIGALRDAALATAVAFGLFVVMVGLRTDVGPTGALFLRDRWRDVLILCALVFVGRLVVSLWGLRPHSAAPSPRGAALMRQAGRTFAPMLLAGALVLPFVPGMGRYELDLGILVLTYVMLGWGLNIVVGLAGLLDLGYVAFYAVGAYSYALLAQTFGLSFWICLPLAGILAAFWGILLGFPVLRLRGDYLAIVTLAFGEIIRIVLLNWTSLTGGPNGIGGIPRPSFFGLPFDMSGGPGTFAGTFGLEPDPIHRVIFLYYLILALALLTNWVSIRIRRQPIGRAWEALREDEIACRALGINVRNTKLTAFALGAAFGGFAGAFFATRQGFISPESFTFIESAIILAIVVLGGLGSQIGVAVAAMVMIGGFELFRDLEEWRMLVFGAAMVVIMVLRPRGLVGSRTPSVALGEKRVIGAGHVSEGRG